MDEKELHVPPDWSRLMLSIQVLIGQALNPQGVLRQTSDAEIDNITGTQTRVERFRAPSISVVLMQHSCHAHQRSVATRRVAWKINAYAARH